MRLADDRLRSWAMQLLSLGPMLVAGVTKAALDAQCLVDALVAAGGDIEPALALYDTEQRRFGCRLVARARHLGAYLEAHPTQNEEERRQRSSLATIRLSCATMVRRS